MGSLESEDVPKFELNDSGCVQDCSVGYKGTTELLDLSDDVLLYILKKCTPRDLKALGHSCHRLAVLICDRTLWQKVDARSAPTGPERLRWYLTHGLSRATQELKLTGYVDKDSNCLGIQDLEWPLSGDQLGRRKGATSPETDNLLLRMWYSHLPRYALTPRWPDKREAAGRAYSNGPEGSVHSLSQLRHLASEIVVGASGSTSNTVPGVTNTGPNSSNISSNSSDSSNIGSNASDSSATNNQRTTSSCQGPQFTLDFNLLRTLRNKCQNLSSLALEYCNLDYRNANLRYFPPNLKKLSLKGSRCYNLPLNTSYLGKIQDRLPLLEYLDISECEWFEPATLMPLSKMKNLQELYMRECRRLTECVAYASLATRYGFQKLRILDVRGSPVADSELSAFGWVPKLEELYASPAQNFKMCEEHTHKWDDVLAPFTELDSWETEEPDYFKCKPPLIEFTDEDEEQKENGEASAMRMGDVMLGNYITYTALERRIIVIHPNGPNQDENRENGQQAGPAPDPDPVIEPAPVPGPAREPERRVQPNRPSVHPYPCVLNLIKTRYQEASSYPQVEFVEDEEPGAMEPMDNNLDDVQVEPIVPEALRDNLEENREQPDVEVMKINSDIDQLRSGVTEPMKTDSDDQVKPGVSKCMKRELEDDQERPSVSKRMKTDFEGDKKRPDVSNSDNDQERPGTSGSMNTNSEGNPEKPPATEPINCSMNPESSNLKPSTSQSAPAAAASASGSSDARPSTSKADDRGPESRDLNIDANKFVRDSPPMFIDPREGRDNSLPNCIKFFCRSIDGQVENARPPMAVHARPVNARNNDGVPYGAFIIDCPEISHIGAMRRPGDNRARRLDIDMHREHPTIPRQFRHFGFHLVSDSAVLRFGRSENDNINYINIGLPVCDVGVRPDRSNLRVLSLTGYRNITDRSLEHLATAAPHLRHIDFSYTSVTSRGVELFKAMQPNCEVVYSSFHDGIELD